jgi:hypothetical protein
MTELGQHEGVCAHPPFHGCIGTYGTQVVICGSSEVSRCASEVVAASHPGGHSDFLVKSQSAGVHYWKTVRRNRKNENQLLSREFRSRSRARCASAGDEAS